MLTKTKLETVADLVQRYTKELERLSSKALRSAWEKVFGDDPVPSTTQELTEILVSDYAEWMESMEIYELETIWEELTGEELRVTEAVKKPSRKHKVA